MFGQNLLNAVVIGCEYMLMATGLSLIVSTMGVINFLHGTFFVIGTYVAYYVLMVFQINYFFALPIAIILAVIVAMLVEKFYYRPLSHNEMGLVIGTIGICTAIANAIALVIGTRSLGVTSQLQARFQLGTVSLSGQTLTIIVSSIILMAMLFFFLNRTKIGKAMQAMGQNLEAASSLGIDINRIRYIIMVIGCGLAVVAGVLMAPQVTAAPFQHWAPLTASFIVVVLGGLGSITGAVIASFILSTVYSFGWFYLGYISSAISFLIVIVILFAKGGGLFGRGKL